jgi:hypothetical protein
MHIEKHLVVSPSIFLPLSIMLSPEMRSNLVIHMCIVCNFMQVETQ